MCLVTMHAFLPFSQRGTTAAYWDNKTLPKWGLVLKEKNASLGANSFRNLPPPRKEAKKKKKEKNGSYRVVFSERVLCHIKPIALRKAKLYTILAFLSAIGLTGQIIPQ